MPLFLPGKWQKTNEAPGNLGLPSQHLAMFFLELLTKHLGALLTKHQKSMKNPGNSANQALGQIGKNKPSTLVQIAYLDLGEHIKDTPNKS